MVYEEKTMKTEKIYEGKILNLRVDTVELPDKKYTKREIVEHPGAVAVLALTDDGEVVLVKQFRKAVEQELLEVPAGKLEVGEEPALCAARELKEETGFTAEKMQYIFEYYTSPGFSNEKIHLFLATGLKEGVAQPENDEYIDIEKIKIEDLVSMISQGNIKDGKTVIAALTVYNILRENS